jgi:hypothetical protein
VAGYFTAFSLNSAWHSPRRWRAPPTSRARIRWSVRRSASIPRQAASRSMRSATPP